MIDTQAHNSDPDSFLHESPFGKDDVHDALEQGDKEKFIALVGKIKQKGISVKNKDYLMWADQYKRYSFVQALIAIGCVPYLAHGTEKSLLDKAIKSEDRRMLLEIVIGCQKIPELYNATLSKNYSLLTKAFNEMTGKERIMAVMMLIKMDFNDLSFYITTLDPVRIYALFNDTSLYILESKTMHQNVKNLINKEISARIGVVGKNSYLK